MTTDMQPAEQGFTAQLPAPQQDPLRALRITANLLPDEILDGRRTRRTRVVVLAGISTVVLALGTWYGSTFIQARDADDELARAETQVVAAQQEQRKYSELTDTKTKLNAAQTQLSTLMANDAQWETLLDNVRSAAPATVKIGQISAAVGTETAAQGERLPSQTTDKLMGTMTLSGSAGDKDQIAAFVDSLSKVTGLANPLPTSVAGDDNTETFTIQLDITQAALGGRFTIDPSATPAPGTTTGGK